MGKQPPHNGNALNAPKIIGLIWEKSLVSIEPPGIKLTNKPEDKIIQKAEGRRQKAEGTHA